MRFRKLAGLMVGALVGGGLSAITLAAPAQAAAATVDVDGTCKYGTFALAYDTPVNVTITDKTVTAELPGATTLGAPGISLQGFGAVLELNIDGQLVTVKGKDTYTPPRPGNEQFTAPTLTGTLRYAVAGDSIKIESLALDLSLFNQSALAPCTGPGITPSALSFYATCTYGSFALPWKSAVDVTVNGTAVTATIPGKATLGAPSISLQGFGAVLGLDIAGQKVTLSGKDTFNPPVPGTSYLAAPTLTGTLATAATGNSIKIESLAMDLSLFGMSAKAQCSTTTTTLTATSSEIGKVALSAKIAPATAGSVEFYEGTTKVGTAPAAASGTAPLSLVGVTGGEHSYTAKFVPTSALPIDTSVSAAVKVTVAAQATATTLTGSSATPNTASLAAKVAPDAPGAVEFYEGATKVGQTPVAAGAATLALAAVSAGTHSYTAKFVPTDATKFTGSTSAAVTVTVAAAPAPPVPGPSASCLTAEANEKAALTKVKAAETKVKGTKAAVKKAQAKVKKATKAVKKASKAKKAKAKKQLKAAKSSLKKAQGKAKAASKKLSSEKTKHAAAVKAASAAC